MLALLLDRYANEVSEIKKGAWWEIVRLNMISAFPIAKVLLIDLRREHFERYIVERLTAVKSSSVNRELNLLSHVLTQARRWRLMSHNPMEDLQRPKDPVHRERLISQREIDAVLMALNYSEEKPVVEQRQKVAVAFLLAIESGMRAGEICSLIAEHVNLDDQTAFLPDTKNGRARFVLLSKKPCACCSAWSRGVRMVGCLGWFQVCLARRLRLV